MKTRSSRCMTKTKDLPTLGNQKSITWRILLPLLLLIVASNALIVTVIMRQLDTQLIDATEQTLANKSELQAVQFRANILELIRDLQFLAGTPPIQGLARAEHNDGVDPLDGSTEQEWVTRLGVIFTEILKVKPSIQIRFIRSNGMEFIRVDRSGLDGSIRLVPSAELQDKSQSQYFTETIALAEGRVYVSEIELNREFGKIVEPWQPVIRAATPIYSTAGQLFGIVIINHNLQATFDQLKSLAGLEQQFQIANSHGEYLVHPDESRRFAFEYQRSSNIIEDFPQAQRMLSEPQLDVVNGVNRSAEQSSVYSMRSVSYNPDNPRDRLILATSHDLQDTLLVKDRLLNKVYMILALVLLLSTGLAIYVSQRIATPIINMRNTLKRDGMATKSKDLPITDSGELGELARVFDNLLQELSHRERLLTAENGERKVAENELRRNNQKLAALNKELSQFTYIASHDLQEPLRTVQSFVELFEQNYAEQLDGEAKIFLGFINESTERMSALIKGLLDYGRLGSESELSVIDGKALVADVCADLALRIADVGGEVVIGELPLIKGRKTDLRLLFQNLISNGLKFTRQGVSPVISIAAELSGDEWLFSVRDNGIGIDAENYQRIFLIFQRLHARDQYEGSGIGLAHCKKIVELHGGKIWLESEVNKGTVFYFTLRNEQDEQA